MKAQPEFEALHQQKVTTLAEQNTSNVNAVKREVVRYLTFLLQYVEIGAAILPEKYQAVADKLDTIILDIMTVAHARRTKANKDKIPPETAEYIQSLT